MAIISYTFAKTDYGKIILNFDATKSGSNLNVKMNIGEGYVWAYTRVDWTMKLQRRTNSGDWATIGTRTGYCSSGNTAAENSPSARTFTGIASSSYPVRVKVDVKSAQSGQTGSFVSYNYKF